MSKTFTTIVAILLLIVGTYLLAASTKQLGDSLKERQTITITEGGSR